MTSVARAAGAAQEVPERPAVMIMARAPRRGDVRHGLEPMIGADGCLALHAALFVEAVRWARSLSPRGIFVAHEPAHAGRELQRLTGEDVTVFPQNGEGIAGRVADGLVRVTSHSSGPVFVVWPDLPRFPTEHGAAALDDLRAGVDLVLGPAFESGYYLVAMARPLPNLFTRGEQLWRGPDSLTRLLGAASSLGLSVGLLRGERALHRPADARAALADPLLPDPIARALRRRT
jgi:glycosyltransferase A (GT-A) superfamily protein (DUF2064 family)